MKRKLLTTIFVIMAVLFAACDGNSSQQEQESTHLRKEAEEGESKSRNKDAEDEESISGKDAKEESDADKPSEGKEASAESKVEAKEAIELPGYENINGILNYRGIYYSFQISNYDSSWQNVAVTSSNKKIVDAWVEKDDPSEITYMLSGEEGTATLTISADNKESAIFTVKAVQGVGEDLPKEHWNASAEVPYAGRLQCNTTKWDIYALTWKQTKNGIFNYELVHKSDGETTAMIFKYTNKNGLFTTDYIYSIYGYMPWDISCFLGLDGNTKEAFMEIFTEYDFSGYEFKSVDTGYLSPTGGKLYRAMRVSPDNPVGQPLSYYIYFEYDDKVNGTHEYVFVEFNESAWEYMNRQYSVAHSSKNLTDEQMANEVARESAERIFNYHNSY